MFKTLPLCLIWLLAITSTATAQYLHYPESVVYDSARGRYLVSNWNSGDLVAIDSLGQQSVFLNDAGCYAGLWLVDDNIYAAAKGEGVKGYSLGTGEPVLDLAIPGTELLNDIVADSSGNIYLSDPRQHKIIKVNTATGDWSNFVTSGINVPNGLWFDSENNRLILVSSRNNSPIQAISLDDSSVTTILNTSIDIMDGIARDEYGNYYISAWGTSSVYKFDSDFTYPPEVFFGYDEQPADIFYDSVNQMLAVPIFYNHRVDFTPVEQTFIIDNNWQLPEGTYLAQNFPNPFNNSTNISFSLTRPQHVRLDIFNLRGQLVVSLVNRTMAEGNHSISWQADQNASGIYFARLTTEAKAETIRMVLLK